MKTIELTSSHGEGGVRKTTFFEYLLCSKFWTTYLNMPFNLTAVEYIVIPILKWRN